MVNKKPISCGNKRGISRPGKMGPSYRRGQPIRTQDSLHLACSRIQPHNNTRSCRPRITHKVKSDLKNMGQLVGEILRQGDGKKKRSLFPFYPSIHESRVYTLAIQGQEPFNSDKKSLTHSRLNHPLVVYRNQIRICHRQPNNKKKQTLQAASTSELCIPQRSGCVVDYISIPTGRYQYLKLGYIVFCTSVNKTIIIIIIIMVMKSGAPLLGLAKYIYQNTAQYNFERGNSSVLNPPLQNVRQYGHVLQFDMFLNITDTGQFRASIASHQGMNDFCVKHNNETVTNDIH